MTLVMLSNGDDPGKVTDASFDRALKKIQKAVKSGQIRQFTGNDYSGLMAKGDVWAAFVWSGDMVQLHADNKHLQFVIPKSGGGIWTDNMLIPKHGDAYLASVYMNFVYDPKIAAEIAAYVNYVSPVKGAREAAMKIDKKVAANKLIFPDDETLSKVKIFDAKALTNQDYLERWQTLIGG
jgi:spermidine/putrescine transport system substrate-binding protein